MTKRAYIIANFGGPRDLQEIEPFLRALLTDRDVIETRLPQPLHRLLFRRVAKKRAEHIQADYIKIGGRSPIWWDTEYIADDLRKRLGGEVLTFHRYLPATHPALIAAIDRLECQEILVFPLFPQFTYATTGSIARFFTHSLAKQTVKKLRWVKSYPTHPSFIHSFANVIREFLTKVGLSEQEVFFLFSAHGLPQSFVDSGDLYAYECHATFETLLALFPQAKGTLCYQSKFGPGEWLRPYTCDLCEQIENYNEGRKYCVFVPLSFTSDHIETLYEVQEQYMPILARKGLHPFRVPALNRQPEWIEAIAQILADSSPCSTPMLLRK